MILRAGISIVVLFFAGTVNANVFDSLKDWKAWEGVWEGSRPECSLTLGYDEPVFGQLMEEYEWEFTGEDIVIERMELTGCHAEISYKVEILEPNEGEVGPPHMKQMRLTRQKMASNCLRPEVRPEQFVVSYIAYPNFFETYEIVKAPQGPCPMGEGIIKQFRRQEANP